MRLLAEFTYLQILDVLTTMAFLLQGVAEANPLVRWALQNGTNPLYGLVMIKAAAMALALFCFWQARTKLLRRVNIFFACLVAYNIVAIILSSPALQG